MKSTFKLIRRFAKILLFSVIILFVINILLIIFVFYRSTSKAGGWDAAERIGKEFAETESGSYTLSEAALNIATGSFLVFLL